jgi:hypothetical protein
MAKKNEAVEAMAEKIFTVAAADEVARFAEEYTEVPLRWGESRSEYADGMEALQAYLYALADAARTAAKAFADGPEEDEE